MQLWWVNPWVRGVSIFDVRVACFCGPVFFSTRDSTEFSDESIFMFNQRTTTSSLHKIFT